VEGVVTHRGAEYNDPDLKKLLLIPAAVAAVLLLWLALASAARRPSSGEPSRLLDSCRGQGPLTVGAAAVPLPLGAAPSIAGFPRLRWTAAGERDPLAVRALVIEEPGCSVALVSAEILLVPWALTAAVEHQAGALGIPRVVLAATHTHAGPGGYWDSFLGGRIATGPYHPAAFSRLAEAVVRALREAQAARRPARLQVGVGDARDLVWNRDDSELDGRLVSVRFTDAAGATIAAVAVLGSHATLLGSGNRLLSGDWPGALMRGAGAPLLFFQGALGDQSARAPGAPTPEGYAGAVAARLAETALSEPDAQPPFAVARASAALPPLAPGALPAPLRSAAGSLFAGQLPSEARVTAVRLGPVTLLAVPAEPVEEVARAWRGAAGAGAEVLSLADDYAGYVEAPERMARGEGETKRTYYGPDLAARLQAALSLAAGATR
jgi:hypothetical protein